ncbi:MAG: AtpZ/AtpI family protein, partial [Actinomycetota bacterium]
PMSPPHQSSDWSGYGTAWTIIATLLSGILAWGGIGWLVDHLVGTSKLFLPIGMVVGMAGSIYLVYLRYGRETTDR